MSEVRRSYDVVAAAYAERFRGELAGRVYDRALLTAFAELVGGGRVADVGCGPGEKTAYLASLGVDAFGVDLSPGMVEAARHEHPGVPFEVGDLLSLHLAAGSLSGAVAMYSLIHIAPSDMSTACSELHRVLAPAGYLLVSFQVGDGVLHVDDAFGESVSLDFRRLQPADVDRDLRAAGFSVQATMTRPADTGTSESTPQAYVVARKR